ncbi:MAG: response regulator [Nitrospirae bacterium]|nr:response regulator [Nitrospirota bacterium]
MKKVLVIEDNKDNLMLITMALEHAGYQVLYAGTGEEGIETALKERPYFILMDINLPGIDGVETTKRIRSTEIGDSIPIIALTSYAMLGDRERILSAGCNGYFEKPIDPLTIIDKIHKIVEVGQ